MSLLNLLTVGNSLSTIEDHPSRYRMRRENLLPHFGADESPAKAIPVSAGDPGSAQPSLPLRELATEPAVRPEQVDAPHHVNGASEPASLELEPLPPPAYPRGRWSLGTAFGQSRSRTSARAVEPVQSELPWEDIPVARNDLNEADVEVVRPAPRPQPAATSHAERPAVARRRPLFRRLKARWFQDGSR